MQVNGNGNGNANAKADSNADANATGIHIQPLSAALLPDFLSFFDGDAFADHPQWAFCYCQFMHVDHDQVQWTTRTAIENRAAACERICAGRMPGLLAFREGKPVGWCNAAPRSMLAAFADAPDTDAEKIGQITCFLVALPHRRSGVAAALLQAACAALKRHGLSIVEASAVSGATTDAQAHSGPLSMFLNAGFHVHRVDPDGQTWVRRWL